MQIIKGRNASWSLEANNEDILKLQKTFLELEKNNDEITAEYKLNTFFYKNWVDVHKAIYEKRKKACKGHFKDESTFHPLAGLIFRNDFMTICKQANVLTISLKYWLEYKSL